MDNVDLRIPRLDRNEAVKTTLGDADRAKLLQMVQSGGYEVVLLLMRAACILQDVKLIAVEPENDKAIIAEQHIAVAKWEFFDWIQKQVAKEVNAHLNPELKDLRTDEEIEADRVLNP